MHTDVERGRGFSLITGFTIGGSHEVAISGGPSIGRGDRHHGCQSDGYLCCTLRTTYQTTTNVEGLVFPFEINEFQNARGYLGLLMALCLVD